MVGEGAGGRGPVDVGVVVVRRAGTWDVTTVSSTSSVRVDLAVLLALLDRSEGGDAVLPPDLERLLEVSAPASDLPPSALDHLVALAHGVQASATASSDLGEQDAGPLDGVRAVRPVTSFTTMLVPGGLLTHGGGAWTVLGRRELALLDAVEKRTKPDAAVRAAIDVLGPHEDPSELLARLGALVQRRRLITRWPEVEASGRPFAKRLAAEARPQPGLLDAPAVRAGAPGRVPVWAPWDEHDLPLGLAMVTAAARHDDRVFARYEVRPPQRSDAVKAEMAAHRGPAVLLLSNYLWTEAANLELARSAKASNPHLLVVHGGPATPKYEDDVHAHFRRGGEAVDVAIRGEGEATLVEALAALVLEGERFDLRGLADVAGLTFRVGPVETAALVRTPDRERITDLDALPSPYLSGEFDHLPGTAATIETNRGCPYGCTFCDWGSATLSRVRKLDLDRVEAEMRWLAARHIDEWTIGDANFGIFERDVEVAERIAAIKRETGYPDRVAYCLAKNTTRHLVRIVDVFTEVGVASHCSLSLQTRDPATLAAVDRRNIKTEHYTSLANEFRRKGLPLLADLMLGLPGQTVDSYRLDLQFLFDLEVAVRTWPTQVLPNSPLNAPAYREEHQIEVDERGLLVATSSYTPADRDAMRRLRLANAAFEHFGLLRHPLRVLQWDHGRPATKVMEHIVEVTDREPHRYPLLAWVLRWFDVHTVPPVGWPAFFAEVRRFIAEELGVEADGIDVALQAQAHLMPDLGRELPATTDLAHDLVSYEADATSWYWEDDVAPRPSRPLEAYGPATLEVWGDPVGLCGSRLGMVLGDRSEVDVSSFWLGDHWELDSPLTRGLSEVAQDVRFRAVSDRRSSAARGSALSVTAAPG